MVALVAPCGRASLFALLATPDRRDNTSQCPTRRGPRAPRPAGFSLITLRLPSQPCTAAARRWPAGRPDRSVRPSDTGTGLPSLVRQDATDNVEDSRFVFEQASSSAPDQPSSACEPSESPRAPAGGSGGRSPAPAASPARQPTVPARGPDQGSARYGRLRIIIFIMARREAAPSEPARRRTLTMHERARLHGASVGRAEPPRPVSPARHARCTCAMHIILVSRVTEAARRGRPGGPE